MNPSINNAKRYKTIFSLLLLTALVIWSGFETGFSLESLALGAPEMMNLVKEMLPPDWSYFKEIIAPMLDTIRMAVLGTTFGSLLALPVALLSANNVFRSRWVNMPVRFLLNIVRTIPDLLLASIFVAVFGIGALPGIFALTVLSFGIVAKLFYEALENIDNGPLEAMTAVGANKSKWIAFGVLPQALAPYLSFVLFTFEINIRAAAVLGLVGAGGIGLFYDKTLGYFEYPKVTAIILFTLLIVIIIDYTSSKVRKKLL
ncbi:phosphonate ABC transporter, permease protein PhnE [Macrococcus equipercicus]|uniref:Phosphonate ABC transporter, permease protein PhnE n=1 Tax=Macrococcus equipercicus TaxID=69967 RepID=A0A9Q9BMB7_9STAP|nr:phosphonate ABC transporter, permease protein PhnE [Macrococcus equipercicus]KAA1039462.1 phosphonate ABC transporter, permease protein PhnE [Macrococcus equipercicus]UTH13760.1 phosphonate ABC transporter, permease protein PhnE [Macrococcus equipercicus]